MIIVIRKDNEEEIISGCPIDGAISVGWIAGLGVIGGLFT